MARRRLLLDAVQGVPLIAPGDDLSLAIITALTESSETLQSGDVLVVAQKIVSKSEDRYVELANVEPGAHAIEIAALVDKDPRLVELVLRESTEIVRHRKGVLIVRHRNGYVYANAGIDQSNISMTPDNPRVLLLPEDPDASAAALRASLMRHYRADIAVIINDSGGRPWRMGVTGFALGCAGLAALESRIGEPDLFGRPLKVTEIAVADELATAASHLMGQADEMQPVVLIRGADITPSETGSQSLIRPRAQDLFL